MVEHDRLVETAPLALMYHENSKVTTASGVYLSESVAEFSDDREELRRLATAHKSYATARRIELRSLRRPRPRAAVDRVLASRRTVRQFDTRKPLSIEAVASLLIHALGVTGRLAHPEDPDIVQPVRAAPSGGALYPIECYLAAKNIAGVDKGVYHFQPVDDVLEDLKVHHLQSCSDAVIWPTPLTAEAPALLILTGRWTRPLLKYGERGYRILLLDAGHIAQNLLLTAAALGLSACPIAGFHDDALGSALQLDPTEEAPLYVIAVG